MRIPTWRLALTGGAIVILLAAGLGLAFASNARDGGGLGADNSRGRCAAR
jgi:hypothetical protein